MAYKTDIEIAQASEIKPINEIAEKLGIDNIDCYGKYKAKITQQQPEKKTGKLILVTAMTPTPAGEGKTTTTVGLGDALSRLGKSVVITLREPSQGPVFGIKGGAAGGGYAQVIPMEDINLHFTGDFHAVTAANNLLAAMIDNHIHQGNSLKLDARRITWKRCMDMNDRQLRSIVSGLGGKTNGFPREDAFQITAASEVMAILCLASDIEDLKKRLGNIIIGYDCDSRPVTAGELKAQGAMAALLKDALKPNLVQTLEHTPAIMHGGPFANIAHGCNSLAATKLALGAADYVVTEAGFGADLGMEKFVDIKCRIGGIKPDAVVIVATVRALKYHGGCESDSLKQENIEALEKGMPNLLRHIKNVTEQFGLPAVVAINKFPTDTEKELRAVEEACKKAGACACISDVWSMGGEGGLELAEEVLRLCEEGREVKFIYEDDMSITEKIESIVTKVYGGSRAEFYPKALKSISELEAMGYGCLPVCIAKTQYSFSDDPSLRGCPSGFTVTVKEVNLCAGAGFIVVLTGDIMTMPGLPVSPSAENIDVDINGRISGLF